MSASRDPPRSSTTRSLLDTMRPEQVTAVRGDLVVTQRNMAVFSEMLSELRPGLEHPEVSSVLPYESTGRGIS